jgi:hypothetical protein
MKPGKQNRQPNCEPNRTPSPQGNGSSLTRHRPRDFGEISPIKGGALAASFDGSFVGALAYEIKGEAADDRHVLGSVSGAQAGLILIESHVEGPVQLVFDGPWPRTGSAKSAADSAREET